MVSIDIRELRRHASRYVRDGEGGGQRVTVTERGRLVAYLVPVKASGSLLMLNRLAAAGEHEPPAGQRP